MQANKMWATYSRDANGGRDRPSSATPATDVRDSFCFIRRGRQWGGREELGPPEKLSNGRIQSELTYARQEVEQRREEQRRRAEASSSSSAVVVAAEDKHQKAASQPSGGQARVRHVGKYFRDAVDQGRLQAIGIYAQHRPAKYLLFYLDGIGEVQEPYQSLCREGMLSLLRYIKSNTRDCAKEVAAAIPMAMVKIKNGFQTKDPNVVGFCLQITNELLDCNLPKGIVRYYHLLLPVLVPLYLSPSVKGDMRAQETLEKRIIN